MQRPGAQVPARFRGFARRLDCLSAPEGNPQYPVPHRPRLRLAAPLGRRCGDHGPLDHSMMAAA